MLDLNSPVHQSGFSINYPKFGTMYNTHATEGVVAVKDSMPRDAVVALRAFRDIAETEEEMQEILDQLMAEGEGEPESFNLPHERNDDDEGASGGGGSNMGITAY